MYFRFDLSVLARVGILGQVRQPMDWNNEISAHSHMMILVRRGDMTFVTGSGTYALTAGSYLLLHEGEAYRVHSRGGCHYAFIHFSLPAEKLSVLPEFPLPEPSARTYPYSLPQTEQDHMAYVPVCGTLLDEQEKIWPMLTECDMYRQALNANRKLRIDLHFAQILSLLDARGIQADRAGYPPVLSRMLMYIHEHYTEALTLSSVSQEFDLSRQYVMRLFQKHLSTTVTHYITRLKMTHALELLRHSSFRVGEVAEILGYSSSYYFCRQFRQQFGMTPTEYIRNSAQE